MLAHKRNSAKAGRRQLQALVRLTVPGSHRHKLTFPRNRSGRRPMPADARSCAPRTAHALRQGRSAITATLVGGAPSRPGAHSTPHPTSATPNTLRQTRLGLDGGGSA